MVNIKNIFFLLPIFIILVFPYAFASIDINISIKSDFVLGETVYFNYTLISNSTQGITYLPYISCPNAPILSPEEKNINLKKDTLYQGRYEGITIDKSIEPQVCIAYIQITEPFHQVEKKSFQINTDPSFEFQLFTCINQPCINKSTVFTRNQNIYLNYTSDVSNPIIIATLTYPDKTTENITLPYSLKAEQIGTYSLKATASKEGYKNTTENIQFAVIAKEAEINERVICNGNGICDSGENYQNCPQDCVLNISRENMKGESKGSERIITRKSKVSSMYIFLAIIVILIILIFAFIRPKRKTLTPKESDYDNVAVGWNIGK